MRLSTVDAFKHLNNGSDQNIRIEGDLLKNVQDVILKIAEDIIEVCTEENICYHLAGGSALGAVRHKGFIPWDDDLDIDILGSDFDRFTSAFSAKYGDKYWINTYHTPGYGILVNRVRLKGSVFRTREDVNNDECGFFVDIDRIENAYDFSLFRLLHGVSCMGFGFLLSCRNFYQNRTVMMELAKNNKELIYPVRIKAFIGRLISFFSVDKWAKLTQWCYALCKNNNSKYVTVPAGRKHFFGELRLRKDFVETRNGEFEGHTWKIPKDYKGYLKSMYGDYMKIPPEDQREAHVVLEIQFPECV